MNKVLTISTVFALSCFAALWAIQRCRRMVPPRKQNDLIVYSGDRVISRYKD